MQSPNATSAIGDIDIGYYLWLAAIGAIVYAYVFATSRAEMANTSLNPLDPNEKLTDDDEVQKRTQKSMPNTGHRVITLLPFVWLYAVLTNAYTLVTIQTASNTTDRIKWLNFFLTVGTLIGLVFASFGATVAEAKEAARTKKSERLDEEIKSLNDEINNLNTAIQNAKDDITKANTQAIKATKQNEIINIVRKAEKEIKDADDNVEKNFILEGSERIGWVTTNIVLLGIIGVVFPIFGLIQKVRGYSFAETFSKFISFASKFVFNFWFPFMMMVYFVKTGVTDWFRIVAITSIVMAIAYNIYNLFFNKEPMKDFLTTFGESLKYFVKTSPLVTYFKYVEGTDLTEVAKRVVIFALLMYVAYLMNSVYKFKNRLVPCVSNSFASCFWNPDFEQTKNNKTYYDPKKTTPYVNALFYTLMMSIGVNIVNFVLKWMGLYSQINDKLNPDNKKVTDKQPEPPKDVNPVTFIQMIIFPFFWIFKLFVQHPIAMFVALVAFAALGLFLYRTSFDLTDFIEGQRGTVITLFTLFIASLIIFGAYAATSKTSSATSSANKATGANNANNAVPSYAEFIGRPFLLIAVAVCIIGIITFLLTSQSRVALMAGLLQYAITAMIYIGGIAVLIGLVRTVFSTSRKMGDPMFQISPDSNWVINVVKLIGNALFYLPCLMLDTVDMLKEQYKLTSSAFLLILAAEAAFILAGLYLPALATKAINHTGVQIVSAPISMSHATESNYKVQFVKSNNADVTKEWSGKANPLAPFTRSTLTPSPTSSPSIQLHNYSYGVSAWFYIHPQPPNSYKNADGMTVFAIGSVGPKVLYNPATNKLTVTINKTDVVASVTDIPLQRWNNIVINSDKGAIDTFINGQLIHTETNLLHKNDNSMGSIVVGQTIATDNGISINGEICNLVLNREPFTSPEIAWFYKTNKSLNPPVVGVNPDPLNQGNAASELASRAVTNTNNEEYNVDKSPNNPLSFSTSGARTYGIIGVVLGALFGWLFNDGNDGYESAKGLAMGAIVFGLIGALLGALFSTDGTVAYIFKTVANVFVNTF